MCTAAAFHSKDFYFGRTLDYEFSYGDQVVILPRSYPLHYLEQETQTRHYAMIGMACVMEDTPLFYDAVNEKGLAIAGLNFVGNACYHPHAPGKENIAQFELIPWLLGQCADLAEARALLAKLNLVDIPFNAQLPTARLHWLITDRTGSITVEAMADGLRVYDNPVEVLTNNPPFPQQMAMLANYRALSPRTPQNTFAPGVDLPELSRGMGGIGLPGDLSSMSRFVRVAFTRGNAKAADDEMSSVSQFFHILGSVEQQRGCCELDSGKYEITLYTSCCNADKGIYYYTTYDNRQITAVSMRHENLDGTALVHYPILEQQNIFCQN